METLDTGTRVIIEPFARHLKVLFCSDQPALAKLLEMSFLFVTIWA